MKFLKNTLFAFVATLLLLVGAPASASTFPTCLTGSWYEPSTSGNGLVIDASDAAVVAYLYTFNAGKPLWLVAQKREDSDSDFDLYSVHGSHINAPKSSADIVGTVSIVPVDANTLTFNLRSTWGSEFCSGFGPGGPLCNVSKTLVRLTAPVACKE